MTSVAGVRLALNRASEEIQGRNGGEWAGWVISLLDTLDTQEADPELYRGCLLIVRDAIELRLEEGAW